MVIEPVASASKKLMEGIAGAIIAESERRIRANNFRLKTLLVELERYGFGNTDTAREIRRVIEETDEYLSRGRATR